MQRIQQAYKQLTSSYRQYIAAVKNGNQAGQAYWSQSAQSAMREIQLIAQKLPSLNIEESVRRKILDLIQQAANAEATHQKTLTNLNKLLNIVQRQKGLCAVCGKRMTVETGCKIHYLRCGNIRTKQMVHPFCHKMLHAQDSETFEPAPQRSGVSLEA